MQTSSLTVISCLIALACCSIVPTPMTQFPSAPSAPATMNLIPYSQLYNVAAPKIQNYMNSFNKTNNLIETNENELWGHALDNLGGMVMSVGTGVDDQITIKNDTGVAYKYKEYFHDQCDEGIQSLLASGITSCFISD